MKAAILVVILLSVIILIPQAHATSLEKFPTSTSAIVAGWSDPTNAYANDANYATTSTANAIQEYSGFGFNFNDTDIIDKVLVWIEFIGDLYVPAADMFADLTADIRVYDGSTWSLKGYLYFYGLTNGLDDCWVDDSVFVGKAIDLTSHVSNSTEVNNMKVRIQQSWSGGSGTFTLQIDYISILVSYTTEKMSFTSGFMLGGVLCGLVAVAAILIVEKKS